MKVFWGLDCAGRADVDAAVVWSSEVDGGDWGCSDGALERVRIVMIEYVRSTPYMRGYMRWIGVIGSSLGAIGKRG